MKANALERIAGREFREREYTICADCPRTNEKRRGFPTFCTEMALMLLVPAIGYCIVVTQLWPLMILVMVIGVMMGIVMFKMLSANFLSCVPATWSSMMPGCTGNAPFKNVARHGRGRLDEAFC